MSNYDSDECYDNYDENYINHTYLASKDDIYDLSSYDNPIIIWTGGSFSPPTNGHMAIAKICASFMYEKFNRPIAMFFVPVNEGYDKQSVKSKFINYNSNAARIDMLNMCVKKLNLEVDQKNITFRVTTLEMDYNVNGITCISVEILKAKIRCKNGYISDESFFISLGQDNVEDILKGKWEDPMNLLTKNIICIPRATKNTDDVKKYLDDNPSITKFITIVTTHIPPVIMTTSSTNVRNKIDEYRKIINCSYTEFNLGYDCYKNHWSSKRYKAEKLYEEIERMTSSDIAEYICANKLYIHS